MGRRRLGRLSISDSHLNFYFMNKKILSGMQQNPNMVWDSVVPYPMKVLRPVQSWEVYQLHRQPNTRHKVRNKHLSHVLHHVEEQVKSKRGRVCLPQDTVEFWTTTVWWSQVTERSSFLDRPTLLEQLSESTCRVQ